jgi:hypothetical protein
MDIKHRNEAIKNEVRVKFGKDMSDPELRRTSTYVTSLNRRDRHQVGGRVFLVPALQAARLLVEGTHEYSTKQEIVAYEEEMQARSRSIREQQTSEEKKFQIVISPEMVSAAVAAQSGQSAATK